MTQDRFSRARLSEVEPDHVPTRVEDVQGLTFQRYFSRPDVHPFDELGWENRVARIGNEKGEVIFEQNPVEVPKDWSTTAVNVVASKYFRGKLGQPSREHSVKQLIGRVVKTIVSWGKKSRYFKTDADE